MVTRESDHISILPWTGCDPISTQRGLLQARSGQEEPFGHWNYAMRYQLLENCAGIL